MAVPTVQEPLHRDQDFLQNSYLTYIIPLSTEQKLEQAIEQQKEPPKAFFESIEDREWLFFGMLNRAIDIASCLTLLM